MDENEGPKSQFVIDLNDPEVRKQILDDVKGRHAVEDREEQSMKKDAVDALVILIFYTLLSYLWEGFVIYKLWGWFVVPLGVAAIGVAHAVGLEVLVDFLKYEYKEAHLEAGKLSAKMVEIIKHKLMMTLVLFTIGWIVHLFM